MMKLTEENISNLTAKEKAELYHRLAGITADLTNALDRAYQESGLTLKDISNVIRKTLKQDVPFLIKELQK